MCLFPIEIEFRPIPASAQLQLRIPKVLYVQKHVVLQCIVRAQNNMHLLKYRQKTSHTLCKVNCELTGVREIFFSEIAFPKAFFLFSIIVLNSYKIKQQDIKQ